MLRQNWILKFTDPVLGPRASVRLRRHLVWQTIRSANSDLIKGGIKPGDRAKVFLGAYRLGQVKIEVVEPVAWADIRLQDAVWGGFDSVAGLARALQNAGYRFKPLEQYRLFRIIFSFTGPRPPIDMTPQLKKERAAYLSLGGDHATHRS